MVARSKETLFQPPGDLSIRAAKALQTDLLDHLSKSSKVVIDLPEHCSADLSFVQTIEAARVFAKRENKALSLAQPAEGSLLEVLQRGGFIDDMTAQDKQFWFHQGEM